MNVMMYVVACGTKVLGGLHDSLESARVAASEAFADGCSPVFIQPVGHSVQGYQMPIDHDDGFGEMEEAA